MRTVLWMRRIAALRWVILAAHAAVMLVALLTGNAAAQTTGEKAVQQKIYKFVPAALHYTQDLAVSRDGTLVVSNGKDYALKIWQTRTGLLLRNLPFVGPFALSDDGQIVAIDMYSKLNIFRTSDAALLHSFDMNFREAGAATEPLSISPDNRYVAAASGGAFKSGTCKQAAARCL